MKRSGRAFSILLMLGVAWSGMACGLSNAPLVPAEPAASSADRLSASSVLPLPPTLQAIVVTVGATPTLSEVDVQAAAKAASATGQAEHDAMRASGYPIIDERQMTPLSYVTPTQPPPTPTRGDTVVYVPSAGFTLTVPAGLYVEQSIPPPDLKEGWPTTILNYSRFVNPDQGPPGGAAAVIVIIALDTGKTFEQWVDEVLKRDFSPEMLKGWSTSLVEGPASITLGKYSGVSLKTIGRVDGNTDVLNKAQAIWLLAEKNRIVSISVSSFDSPDAPKLLKMLSTLDVQPRVK